MSLNTKIETAGESAWLNDHLSQEEINAAIYIGQIASAIQRHRRDKGYTQRELAKRLGVSQVMVSRWENGEENFTIATLAKIAVALEIEWFNPFEQFKTVRKEFC